jgi:hypothetical protein
MIVVRVPFLLMTGQCVLLLTIVLLLLVLRSPISVSLVFLLLMTGMYDQDLPKIVVPIDPKLRFSL